MNTAAKAWDEYLANSMQRKWRAAEDRASQHRMLHDLANQELGKQAVKKVGYVSWLDSHHGLFSTRPFDARLVWFPVYQPVFPHLFKR